MMRIPSNQSPLSGTYHRRLIARKQCCSQPKCLQHVISSESRDLTWRIGNLKYDTMATHQSELRIANFGR